MNQVAEPERAEQADLRDPEIGMCIRDLSICQQKTLREPLHPVLVNCEGYHR